MRGLIETLRAPAGPDASPIVLKNPWDTGRESLLLKAFPGCRVVVVRRGLGAVEESARSALTRYHRSPHYLRALMNDSLRVRAFLTALRSPLASRALPTLSRLQVHLQVLRLTHSLRRLPAGTVALLSYDELLADPVTAARYVEHLMPADPLAHAFNNTVHAYSDHRAVPPVSRIGRIVEKQLLKAWHALRARQVSTGVIELP